MKNALLITIFLHYGTLCAAQSIVHPAAAPYLHSGAYSKLFNSNLSAPGNIAALTQLPAAGLGVYSERRFMLEELSLHHLSVNIPSGPGNFAFLANYFGYTRYNQSQISLGYARKLATNINLGTAFNYTNIRIPGYGSASAIHFQVGAIFQISERLRTGMQLYNPFSARIGKHSGQRLASVYTAGLGYEWSENLLTTLEIRKEQEKPAAIHTGLQYQPINVFLCSAGYVSEHNQFYFGVGYMFKQFRLDLSASTHQYMGWSPALLLLYKLPLKKTE